MDRHTNATTPVTPLATTVSPVEPPTRVGSLDDTEADEVVPLVPVPGCTCVVCASFVSRWAIDQIEVHIMDLVADLLDHGWEPEDLVDDVERLALRGPCAGPIITLALVSHAGTG